MRKSTWILAGAALALTIAAVSIYPQRRRAANQVSMPPGGAPGGPTVAQLTSSPEEQDFPAVAQSGDSVYVSYVQFVHSDRALEKTKFNKAPRELRLSGAARRRGSGLSHDLLQIRRASGASPSPSPRPSRTLCARPSPLTARSACGFSGRPTSAETSISSPSRWPAGNGHPKCV